MNEQGAQQQQRPPEQQHEERAILSQLQEMHGAQPGTFQATINAEQPADVLRNTHPGISLDRPDIPHQGAQHMAFENENDPFYEDHHPDLFGISSSMPNSSSRLVLGVANDFSSPSGPYELFVPSIQYHATVGPQENMQPRLDFVPAQPESFSLQDTVSNPAHLFPRGSGPRSRSLPKLTLQTENLTGRNISYPSSRRLSWQSNIPSSVHSQLGGTTPSFGTCTTPSFGSRLDPFNAPEPPVCTTPSIGTRFNPFNAPEPPVCTPSSLYFDQIKDSSLLDDAVADNKRDDPRDIQVNPPSQTNASPLREPQQRQSPRPLHHFENRCPKCYHLFTSKRRDLSRDIRRHLQLSCPKRDTIAPRLSCSVPDCRKTFVRDSAKRLHEERQHGIVRGGRRRAGSGAIEDRSMRRASSTENAQEDVVRQTPIQPSVLTKDQSASQQEDGPIGSSSIEMKNPKLQNNAQIEDMQPKQRNIAKNPFFHDSPALYYSTSRLRASEAVSLTEIPTSLLDPPNKYASAFKGIKAAAFELGVDYNVKDSGYVSTTDPTRTAPVDQDEQKQVVACMNQEDSFDDAATVATDGMELSLPKNTKGYFIQQFAEELLTTIPPATVPAESLDRVFKVLPDLLRQYAIRLTKKAQPRSEKDAVTFVRQNRMYIAAALHENWCAYQDLTRRKFFPSGDHAELSWEERVNQWKSDDSANASQIQEPLKHLPDAYDEDEASEIPDFSVYKPHLLGGEAYKWLISRLRSEFLLAKPEAFAMEQIRETILQQLSRYEKARIWFHLDWNPSAFFEEQGYKGNLADELSRAITITGSPTMAQTTSCERYLLDTWPATGALTLKALQYAISETQDHTPAYTLQNPNLRVSLRRTHTEVEIVGDKDFITDIGQQLGWIGAALRSSAIDGQMCYCVPSVTYSEGIFTIEYTSDPVSATETILSGNCWHPLFNNPAIVRGFPIATRCTGTPDEDLPGLEIPLNMMAELAEAKRVTEIDGRLLIKGFSTLFVPTKRVDDLVIWHMLYNDDDSRISYFDFRGIDISDMSVKGLTFPALESSRHILGWCSVVRNLAGSKHAKYDVKTSGLSQPGQGWTFEKVSISGGKIINGGVTFGKGNINTPLHLRRQPVYVKQIYEASCKHVIFYDVGDKRAWLVNGAAALLHLARAYLVFASKHPFLSTMAKFRINDLWGPDDEYEASAPFKTLCSSTNMDLVIYEDWKPANEAVIDAEGNFVETAKVKDAHFRFRDQVDEIYHIWEQIQEFQTKMTDNIRLTDRDKLQGFNFVDVATGESPIKPRFTYLERSGRGWVDLARSLDAITLFGRGFGELLQPSSASNKLCHSWSQVPTGKDYLAVSMSDVSAIFDKRGNATSRPMELVDGLFWHKADKLFEPCECADAGSRKRRFILGRGTMCDRVQVLLPPSLGRKVDPGALEEKGAVIFGRSERFRWHWPNQGQPNETTGSDEDSESERPQKKARSSPSSQGSQVSEVFSGDTQQTSATSVSGDASSSSRTETPVKK